MVRGKKGTVKMINSNGESCEKRNSSSIRRISFLIGIIIFASMVLGWRLFSKSVLEHKEFTAMAQEQYIVERKIPSSRGLIYAQDKYEKIGYYPLALNEEKYQVLVIPKNLKNKSEAAKTLSSCLALDEKELWEKINNDKAYIPPIAHRLDRAKAQEILKLNLAGVLVTSEEIRTYPEDNLASQIMGFVDAEDKGRYGIEGFYNEELSGSSGEVVAEKDTLGRLISIGERIEAQDGANLYLTIDRNIQYIAQKYLSEAIKEYEAENGSVTIIEPKTGKVLAMAASPDYSPNTYYETAKEHSNYFTNPIISYVWEPGSVFKTISMAVALDLGRIEPDTEDVFSNMTVVSGYEIHTAQDKAFGRETMTKCLENSDNVCLVWVADKIGNDDFLSYLQKFNFGEKFGIDLAGEAAGTVLEKKNWRDVSRATMSFGQGISVTPLQMTMAISALANDGYLMKPYILDKMIKPNGEVIKNEPKEIRQVISKESSGKIKGMMISVVENGHGKKAKVPGYQIAGKTGTAQIPDPNGGYFEDQHIGSFGGFFPVDNPRFAMLVKLDKPKNVEWAEASAAPTFGKIAAWLLNYYEIKPEE